MKKTNHKQQIKNIDKIINDAKILKQAQLMPSDYPNIKVMVGNYKIDFLLLDHDCQNDIIFEINKIN
jgi:autonomous glycyl radical cofactor GrcA